MMTPHEAELLLGGHATGTLTAEEQAKLYAAALAHQEVFDALADEEALRELLADPAVRARLIAQLAPARVVPLWRRPTVLGLAASVFLVVTTSLVLKRTPAEKALQPQVHPATREASPPQDASPAPKPAAPQKQGPQMLVPEAADTPSTEGYFDRRPAPQTAPASPSRGLEGLLEPAPRGGAAGAAATPAPAPEAQRAAPKAKAADKATWGAEKAPEPKADAYGYDQADPGARARKKDAALAQPHWQVESLGGGRTRVTVTFDRRGTLVLLRRQGGTTDALASLRTIPAGEDRTTAVFEMGVAGDGVLDLYLLNAPVAQPTALSPTGPVDGFRVRLVPPR